jgi:hypothetical protein
MDFAEDSDSNKGNYLARYQSKQEEDIDDADTTESSSESVVAPSTQKKAAW